MERKLKIIKGLQEFQSLREINIKMELKEKIFTVSSRKTQNWEIIGYILFPLIFWIWWIFENETSNYTLFLLVGFTVFWIYQYYLISEGENTLVIDLDTEIVEVRNINPISSRFINPIRFHFSKTNQIEKTEKSFSRYSKTYSLSIINNKHRVVLLNIDGDYESDKILFGLNLLIQ